MVSRSVADRVSLGKSRSAADRVSQGKPRFVADRGICPRKELAVTSLAWTFVIEALSDRIQHPSTYLDRSVLCLSDLLLGWADCMQSRAPS